MIPLSPTAFVSPLEVPTRTSLRTEYFFGGKQIGSITNVVTDLNVRDQLWSMTYLHSTLSFVDPNGKVTTVYKQSGLQEISAAFDRYMLPVICFIDSDGVCWVRYYDTTHQGYQLVNITKQTKSGTVTTPRICFDDRRVVARNNAQIILAYYDQYSLMMSSDQTGFTSPITLRVEDDQQPHYLQQVAMGENLRLQFPTYTKQYLT